MTERKKTESFEPSLILQAGNQLAIEFADDDVLDCYVIDIKESNEGIDRVSWTFHMMGTEW